MNFKSFYDNHNHDNNHYNPCDKQDYCNRVLDFFPVNNFVHRMTEILFISISVNEQTDGEQTIFEHVCILNARSVRVFLCWLQICQLRFQYIRFCFRFFFFLFVFNLLAYNISAYMPFSVVRGAKCLI